MGNDGMTTTGPTTRAIYIRARIVPSALILLGAAGVVAAVWLLAGYPWAIGVMGTLALAAGVLLYDPKPPTPKTWPNNRGVR